ncbi:MAG TPA: ATP-binding cassette domain-containing protein [Vicinamibacterales bacterium]
MANAIVLKNLTKTFGETVAVRDIALAVPDGALYGLIGPNGAGKTTMVRMILSILFPDHGELTVLGRPSAMEAKDRIGYLPEERGLYKKMRVGEFLVYMARLKGLDGQGVHRQVREWLQRVELGDTERKRCEELSKGMQQKVQFVAAVIHRPDLLILDEPFSGLDPVNQRLMRDLVLDEHRRGATILFSTHIMTHAEQLCDHVVMIHRGEKVLDRTMAGIRETFDPHRILFEPLDPDSDITKLRALPGVRSVTPDGPVWDVALDGLANPASVIPLLVTAVTPSRVEIRRPTLEDVFVSIVTGDASTALDDDARLRAALRDGGQEVRR